MAASLALFSYYWLRVCPAFGFGQKLRKCGGLRWMATSSDQTGQDKLSDRASVNFVQQARWSLAFFTFRSATRTYSGQVHVITE
jgi:hypothetical protein